MPSISEFLAECVPTIENDLRAVLTPLPDSPPRFYHMLQYHMGWLDEAGQPIKNNGGKRIRPALCLLAAMAAGGKREFARPPAAAVELIHNFSLLHDDIQDQSPTRRGRTTVWKVWGSAQAINAGDAMFALAHLAIPRLAPPDMPPSLIASVLTILDETSLELTRGQHLDMVFETQQQVAADEYLDMVAGKTSALVAASAMLGAASAGADSQTQARYCEFGASLGMAFQITDDILDIWGAPELTGKQAGIDIYQKKKTLPVLFGLEKDAQLREMYAAASNFTQSDVVHITQRLETCGARDYAEEQAAHYSNQTIQHLEMANPQGDTGQLLLELVEMLLRRQH